MRREPEELVLPSEADTPLHLSRPWETIRKRAGMADLRIHDLRHTAASVLAA
jgi:integrase